MTQEVIRRPSFTRSDNPAIESKVEAACHAYEMKNYGEALSILLPLSMDPAAKCFLGMVYLDDPDQISMRQYGWSMLIESAETGYEYAWHVLGNRYLRLEKNTHNLEQASRWFLKAAELGCLDSQYALAWCYCNLYHYVAASKWLFVTVALGNTNAARLCNSIQIKMGPEDYELAEELALEWLLLKRHGKVDSYYMPLRMYCNLIAVGAHSF